ncbi:cubilin-like isoform X1 [Littorina saxatilis]|uniref:CUB domain-containing protein n=1 Tax=Littorina saxatilis TaxID=31220 RepID=A0AAN9BFL7_9CAEN
MAAIFLFLLSAALLDLSAAKPPAKREKRSARWEYYDVHPVETITIQSEDLGENPNELNYPNNAEWFLNIYSDRSAYLNIQYDVDIESTSDCSHDALTLGAYVRLSHQVRICGTQSGTFSVSLEEYYGEYYLSFMTDSRITGRGFNLTITADHYPYYSTTDLPHYNRPADGGMGSTPYNYNDYTSNYHTTDRYNTDRYATDRYNTDRYTTNRYNTDRYNTDRYATDQYNTNRYNTDRYNTYRSYGDYSTDYSTDYYSQDYYGTSDDGWNYNAGTTEGSSPAFSTSCQRYIDVYEFESRTINSSAECDTVQGNYPDNADWTFTIWTMSYLSYLNIEFDVDIESETSCRYDKLTFGYDEIHVCGTQRGTFSVHHFDPEYLLRFQSDGSVTGRGFNLTITADTYPYYSTTDLPHYNRPADGGMGSTPYNYNDYTSNYHTTDRYNTDRYATDRYNTDRYTTDRYNTDRYNTYRSYGDYSTDSSTDYYSQDYYGTSDDGWNYNAGTTEGSSPAFSTSCQRTIYVFEFESRTIDSSAECDTVQGNYPNNADWTITIRTMIPFGYLNIEYDVDIENSDDCVFDTLTFGYTGNYVNRVCGTHRGTFSALNQDTEYIVRFRSDGSGTGRGFNVTITVDDYPYYSTTDLPYHNSPANGTMSNDYTSSYYTTDRYATDRYPEYPRLEPSNGERKTARLETLGTELRELVDSVREAVLSFDDFQDVYYHETPRHHNNMPSYPEGYAHDGMARDNPYAPGGVLFDGMVLGDGIPGYPDAYIPEAMPGDNAMPGDYAMPGP